MARQLRRLGQWLDDSEHMALFAGGLGVALALGSYAMLAHGFKFHYGI